MKKLIAILLSILMINLIFASCNTGGEEVSGEPVSEVSSVEISSALSTNSLESLETSDEYTLSRIFVNDCYLYLLEFVNQDGTVFGLYFENIPPGISVFSENVYKIVVTAGTGVARVQYYDVLKKELITSEEESSTPAKSLIPYSAEDERYFNQYTKRFFLFPAEFNHSDDLSADDLRWIYTFIYDFFPGISDDFGAKYEREDGLFYIPLQDMVTELEKFLGENFEEKLKTHPEYDAEIGCIIVPTFGGLGGAYGVEPAPVPIRREGENVILPLYFYEDESYSKITTAIEYTIYEFDGGFYLRGCKRFSEEEIADLNEQYFGEA